MLFHASRFLLPRLLAYTLWELQKLSFRFLNGCLKGGVSFHFDPKFVTDCKAHKPPAILCIFIEFYYASRPAHSLMWHMVYVLWSANLWLIINQVLHGGFFPPISCPQAFLFYFQSNRDISHNNTTHTLLQIYWAISVFSKLCCHSNGIILKKVQPGISSTVFIKNKTASIGL